MINLKVNDADRILIVEMSGMISEADIDGAIDALQEQYPAVGVHLRGGQSGGFQPYWPTGKTSKDGRGAQRRWEP